MQNSTHERGSTDFHSICINTLENEEKNSSMTIFRLDKGQHSTQTEFDKKEKLKRLTALLALFPLWGSNQSNVPCFNQICVQVFINYKKRISWRIYSIFIIFPGPSTRSWNQIWSKLKCNESLYIIPKKNCETFSQTPLARWLHPHWNAAPNKPKMTLLKWQLRLEQPLCNSSFCLIQKMALQSFLYLHTWLFWSNW